MRLLMFFLLAGFFNQLYAQININAPQTLNQDNETYVLTRDIVADGTAFTIDGNNITLDLGAYTVTYNNSTNGAGIIVNGNNNKVKNGFIVQGAGRSGTSPAVYLSGKGSEHIISYLGIKVNGKITAPEQYAAGIEVYAHRSSVHHVYIENHGTTNNISYSPRGIYGGHKTTAGFVINDNIIYGSHMGIGLDYLGLNVDMPEKTRVFNNYIQHTRSPGTKSAYGIGLGKCRNLDIFNNQIISDDGRGIMLDGFGQGVPRGTDFINVYNNRVDVEYNIVATSGPYVENNVYGIRNRYSSGNNTFTNNTVMVNNKLGGVSAGLYIGSDDSDPLMVNLSVSKNKIIARSSDSDASAIRYGVAVDLSVTDNRYFANVFSANAWEYDNNGGIDNLTVSNNNAFAVSSYTPAKPGGLKLKRFFDSYVLTWSDNGESETFEYIVYRDGVPLDISTRGGTFYVDGNASGAHTYTVVAKNLKGNVSQQSDPISTNKAEFAWAFTSIRPNPPQNIQVTITKK